MTKPGYLVYENDGTAHEFGSREEAMAEAKKRAPCGVYGLLGEVRAEPTFYSAETLARMVDGS